jgi:hypothetical protein
VTLAKNGALTGTIGDVLTSATYPKGAATDHATTPVLKNAAMAGVFATGMPVRIVKAMVPPLASPIAARARTAAETGCVAPSEQDAAEMRASAATKHNACNATSPAAAVAYQRASRMKDAVTASAMTRTLMAAVAA